MLKSKATCSCDHFFSSLDSQIDPVCVCTCVYMYVCSLMFCFEKCPPLEKVVDCFDQEDDTG